MDRRWSTSASVTSPPLRIETIATDVFVQRPRYTVLKVPLPITCVCGRWIYTGVACMPRVCAIQEPSQGRRGMFGREMRLLGSQLGRAGVREHTARPKLAAAHVWRMTHKWLSCKVRPCIMLAQQFILPEGAARSVHGLHTQGLGYRSLRIRSKEVRQSECGQVQVWVSKQARDVNPCGVGVNPESLAALTSCRVTS